MKTLVECIPNFSEGRDHAKVEKIVQAIRDGPDVHVLDLHSDPDHNRSVITFVGSRGSVGEAALRGVGEAVELIDLTHHKGIHPRIGAADVVPFVPIQGVTLADCAEIAEQVGKQIARRFRVPVYLYGAAARTPESERLERVRRGQFESLLEAVRCDPARRPDFGGSQLHPTAGATAVGVRPFLIAFNVNLNTSDVAIAKAIAKKIRHARGGLPGVKAMGVLLKSPDRAQVSVNITDYQQTPLRTLFEAVESEAGIHRVRVAGSELVGLIPRAALEPGTERALMMENFSPDVILEDRLARLMKQ